MHNIRPSHIPSGCPSMDHIIINSSEVVKIIMENCLYLLSFLVRRKIELIPIHKDIKEVNDNIYRERYFYMKKKGFLLLKQIA